MMATVSVRYLVDDVDTAVGFHRDLLGFTIEMHPAPSFAALFRGDRACCSTPGPDRAVADSTGRTHNYPTSNCDCSTSFR
jgi:hypothetical protein